MVIQLVLSKPVDQTVREFCAQNGLSEAQYYYWKSRGSKTDDASEATNRNSVVPKSGFTRVRVKGVPHQSSGVIASLNFPGGAVLSIFDPVVIPELAQLVGQLRPRL